MKTIMPSVLIVILNYGTYDLTLKMIHEIKEKLEYDNYSIMVVDNCSPNESAKILKQKSKELNYLFYENKENAGYAVGNNIGIRYGIQNGYRYSWVLNNDVEIRDSNALSDMIQIAEQNKKIGWIGPKIYSLDGTVCAPYCNRPTAWSMTLGIVREKRIRKKFINTSREVYRIYGCCMLLLNDAMKEIDCMDERTFLYGEEDILAERLIEKGYVAFYDANVSVTHKESSSMKRMSTNRRKMQIQETNRSMDLYLKDYRHYSWITRKACLLMRNLITLIR